MKIGVIGAGRLGLSFALLCENSDYVTFISDKNKKYLTSINDKELFTNEPGVIKLLNKTENLVISNNNFDVIDNCDIIYIFVNTPSLPDGTYDVSSIWEIIKEFEGVVENKQLVIGSTINPEDCNKFKKELGSNIQLYYIPTFIAQGSIIEDINTNSNILVGSDVHNLPYFDEIYLKILKQKPKFTIMSYVSAEITKIALNSFITAKISFANMIGDTLHKSSSESEIDKCLDFIAYYTGAGQKFFKYGFGYGGPCLPRDNSALSAYIKSTGLNYTLCPTLDKCNDVHANYLKDYYLNKNSSSFLIKSITYRKECDSITDSQQIRLAIDLLQANNIVYIFKDDNLHPEIESDLKNRFKEKIQFVTELPVTEDELIIIDF